MRSGPRRGSFSPVRHRSYRVIGGDSLDRLPRSLAAGLSDPRRVHGAHCGSCCRACGYLCDRRIRHSGDVGVTARRVGIAHQDGRINGIKGRRARAKRERPVIRQQRAEAGSVAPCGRRTKASAPISSALRLPHQSRDRQGVVRQSFALRQAVSALSERENAPRCGLTGQSAVVGVSDPSLTVAALIGSRLGRLVSKHSNLERSKTHLAGRDRPPAFRTEAGDVAGQVVAAGDASPLPRSVRTASSQTKYGPQRVGAGRNERGPTGDETDPTPSLRGWWVVKHPECERPWSPPPTVQWHFVHSFNHGLIHDPEPRVATVEGKRAPNAVYIARVRFRTVVVCPPCAADDHARHEETGYDDPTHHGGLLTDTSDANGLGSPRCSRLDTHSCRGGCWCRCQENRIGCCSRPWQGRGWGRFFGATVPPSIPPGYRVEESTAAPLESSAVAGNGTRFFAAYAAERLRPRSCCRASCCLNPARCVRSRRRWYRAW